MNSFLASQVYMEKIYRYIIIKINICQAHFCLFLQIYKVDTPSENLSISLVVDSLLSLVVVLILQSYKANIASENYSRILIVDLMLSLLKHWDNFTNLERKHP